MIDILKSTLEFPEALEFLGGHQHNPLHLSRWCAAQLYRRRWLIQFQLLKGEQQKKKKNE